MAFKFNFSNPDCTSEEKSNQLAEERNEADHVIKKDAAEIYPKLSEHEIKEFEAEATELNLGSLKIKLFSPAAAIKHLKNSGSRHESIVAAEKNNSDLLPGIYEGGLKIWECSLDLAKFLCERKCICSGMSVLELGCGAGLPGVVAYLSGAKVTFQDYNEEVLNSLTSANVVLNTSEADQLKIAERCRFLAGDWEKIQSKYCRQLSPDTLYDTIVTSETIYEKRNHRKLLELMKHTLKPRGTVYLAAKLYYFGVGGSLVDFEDLVQEDGVFEVQEFFRVPGTEGVGRAILTLKFKDIPS